MAVQYLRIQTRRDTKAAWEAANPVLLVGEVGYELPDDSSTEVAGRSKTGDGSTTWSNLPYNELGLTGVGDDLAVSADGTLSVDLSAKADITYVDAADALKADITYVDAADALKADVTALQAETAARTAADSAEATARVDGDAALQTQITDNKADFDTFTGTTGTRLSSLETDATTQTAVDAGDQALSTRLDAVEVALPAKADATVTAGDYVTGGSAVDTVDISIGELDAQAKVNADAVATKAEQADLLAEIAARGQADDALTLSKADAAVTAGEYVTGGTAAGDVGVAIGELDAQAKVNADAIATKANSADVYAQGQLYTKTETDGLFDALLANDNVGPDHAWTGQNSFSQTITGDISGSAATAGTAGDATPGSTLEGALAARPVKGEFGGLTTTLTASETDPATIAAALVQLVADLNAIDS